jgi:Holliday junction resolvase RusA-like endonuclease
VNTNSFTIPGDPVGKPAWHNADKWQTGDEARPPVQKYRTFCEEARFAATGDKNKKIEGRRYLGYMAVVHIAMPASWSPKKKAAYAGTLCQSKPDKDNIEKALADALFDEDKYLCMGGVMAKLWALPNEGPRIDIFLIGLAEHVAEEETDGVTEEPETE